MMKMKFKKTLLVLLCVAMLVPACSGFAVFAEEEEKSFEEIWNETIYPAYMGTKFDTINDRLLVTNSPDLNPMVLYAVVDGIAFYLDSITGEMIALTLVDSTLTKEAILEAAEAAATEGKAYIPEYKAYYSTNPYNAGSSQSSQGQNSSEPIKQELYSQLIIQYTQTKNNTNESMNSFTHAAANNQISVSNIRGGVRVEYSIGREQVTYLVPRLIRKEKFETLLAQVAKNSDVSRDVKTLEAFYIYYDKDDPNKAIKTIQTYLKEYPVLEKFPLYACERHITTRELLRVENIIKLYTDYTLEQMEIDHAETEYVSTEENPPLFKLAIEYKVDGEGGITIRLNAGNIRFASDLYALSNVTFLPYGGAGDTSRAQQEGGGGYIFIPDGSGALIDFKDVSGNFTSVNPLYGIDNVYHTVTGQNREIMRLPVFGVVEYANVGTTEEVQEKVDENGNVIFVLDENGDYVLDENGQPVPETETVQKPLIMEIGYLAIIEEGDSLAKIAVKNGGSLHSYVSVYTTFNPRPQDTYELDGGIVNDANATWTVESKRKYTGDFKIRLFMMEDANPSATGDINYSQMARVYREYLIGKGVLSELKSTKEDIPLYLETLGAMQTTDTVLGVAVDKQVALSSFADDKAIIDELAKNKISNVNLKLNGWINGGMFMTAACKMDIEEVLGGEDGLHDLIAHAKKTGATIFPDFELSLVHEIEWFDGFDLDDLARTIDDREAIKKEYDPTWQAFWPSGSAILSPRVLQEYYEDLYEDYKDFNVGAISVCSLGEYLNSDFNEDDPLTREDSKVLVKRLLKKISQQNAKVMINGGNAYALEYATDILEMPLDSSNYLYASASIPFMSMVLHGYKEYAGIALNLAGDYQYTLLKSIESGASPYFIVASNNTSVLKDYAYSILSEYYSVRYLIWKDSIVDAYNVLNSALKSVKTATIKNHEFLDYEKKVVKVTYSNGDVFYINYLIDEYTVREGDTLYDIPSNGFVKVSSDNSVVTYDGTAYVQQ